MHAGFLKRHVGRPPNRPIVWYLVLPRAVAHWSLTTLREKLVKIGAKVVRHVIVQMAEVAAPMRIFATILQQIARLRDPPPSPDPPVA